jgi:pantetheine-phosphate adenylyltransferase
MSEFVLVAMGGTFDIIHKGHLTLLSKAFSISSKVIIGLTSDELTEKRGKKTLNNYEKRLETLMSTIKINFPNHAFQISKLDNDFGPAVLEENVQALVVSDETGNQGEILNQLRTEKNLSSVKIVIVPMVLAQDGNRISTTRIKNSEIDVEGNLSSID